MAGVCGDYNAAPGGKELAAMICRRFVVAMVLALLCVPRNGVAQAENAKAQAEQQIEQVEQRWLQHESDPEALESILAPDFIHVLPAGFITKDEQIDYLRRHPEAKGGSHRFEKLRARVFGRTGVAYGIVAATDANGRAQRTAFTDVFAYRDERWQAVQAQELPLGETGQTALGTGSLPPNLEDDVRSANQDWVEAYKAGDAARMAAPYADDAVFCTAAGQCVKGPAAITVLYRERLAKSGPAIAGSISSDGLRVDHDLAYESGAAELRFRDGKVAAGRFSTVWQLRPNGHWKILRNMSLAGSGK